MALQEGRAEDLEALRGQIELLVERVDELLFDVLREAVAAGALERPEVERRLSRVRGALQRAVAILDRGAREGLEEGP